jgi:hypothetical protein
MIISGGSRSNWRFFAKHLTNAKDNERVSVEEIRGVSGDNVLDALREMDAVASGTRCENFFYHADLNPRAEEHLNPEQWGRAVDILEKQLGFEGQPRIVVEHVKHGREHRHIIWSRIDTDSMTALPDSLTYQKHDRASREIEAELGLEPVASVLVKDRETARPERRPKNWETFRGTKSGIDPEAVKTEVTALWKEAESGKAFAVALAEHGYALRKGDRRDFCIIDPAGNEHSLARRIDGVKAAEIRTGMADIDRDGLPSVAEGRAQRRGDRQRVAVAGAAGANVEKVAAAINAGRAAEVIPQTENGDHSTERKNYARAFDAQRKAAKEPARESLHPWGQREEAKRREREKDREPER